MTQASYNICHVSAHSSWDVAGRRHGLRHVSAYSSWGVVQSNYYVRNVSVL